jgi:hypothetical protein
MNDRIIVLPLIVGVPAALLDNPDLPGDAIRPTVTIQLDAQSGQILQLPLSELAADQLLKVLSSWRTARQSLTEHGLSSEPKPTKPN